VSDASQGPTPEERAVPGHERRPGHGPLDHEGQGVPPGRDTPQGQPQTRRLITPDGGIVELVPSTFASFARTTLTVEEQIAAAHRYLMARYA
jgi:hypothetical protein